MCVWVGTAVLEGCFSLGLSILAVNKIQQVRMKKPHKTGDNENIFVQMTVTADLELH